MRCVTLALLAVTTAMLSVAPLGHLPSDHQRWGLVVETVAAAHVDHHGGVHADHHPTLRDHCLGCLLGTGWSALLASASFVAAACVATSLAVLAGHGCAPARSVRLQARGPPALLPV